MTGFTSTTVTSQVPHIICLRLVANDLDLDPISDDEESEAVQYTSSASTSFATDQDLELTPLGL